MAQKTTDAIRDTVNNAIEFSLARKLEFHDNPKTFSRLRKGDLFHFPGSNHVKVYDGKCRMYDKWGKYKGWGFQYNDYYNGDIGNPVYTMTNRSVEIY